MRTSVGLLSLLLLLMTVSTVPAERRVEFSGYEWIVRRSGGLEGPGPNRFSDASEVVRVDESGGLRLAIVRRGAGWVCAEVILDRSLGYGTYEFAVEIEPGALEPQVILGMFTYDDDAPDAYHREIDVELGRFGNPSAPAAQFVLQPAERYGNRLRYELDEEGTHTTHAFRWEAGQITFRSVHGHHEAVFGVPDSRVTATWSVRGDRVPAPADERVRINLWLYQGETPSREHEVVVRRFSFYPLER
ncbi:MAG: glycoside hydrolase family 16 protein [Spirochaetota bacterium]